MHRHPRTRRIAKWIGLVLCVLIVVAWVINLWYAVSINSPSLTCWIGDWTVYFSGPGSLAEYCWRTQGVVDVAEYFHQPKLRPVLRGPTFERAWMIGIPLWLVLVVVATPTVILWRRDRRIPPGHCQKCGYNLTGNVSGRCPECGEAM